MRFLGIDIDARKLELSLPTDKLWKLQEVLEKFKGKSKAKQKELERLGGLLAHCLKVIRGGRTFCRPIYNLIETLREPHFYARLGKGFREDIDWWRRFAKSFNGKATMMGKFSPVLSVYSDASNWGMGAIHIGDWLVGAYEGMNDKAVALFAGHHHALPGKPWGGAYKYKGDGGSLRGRM